MPDPRLRLRHLRCFLEVARTGSVTAASDALHVSQPAASKTLRELEEILGTALFDRTGRRLVPTRAGRLFQTHAGAALVELDRAQALARGVRRRTRLAVGVLPTASTDLMPRAALAFRARHPDCVLRVGTGPNWLLLSQLREGALDMIVGRMAAPEAMTGLTFRPLRSEPIIAVVRPGHPLLQRDDPLAALADFPLLLPPSGAVIAPAVRAWLIGAGLGHAEAAMESVSLPFGRAVVQRSDTVWLISRGVVQAELAAGTLADLPLPSAPPPGPVGVSLRDGAAVSPEQASLVALLEAAAAPPGSAPGHAAAP